MSEQVWLEGVISVESGYAGGSLANPTYKEITTGTTGHAEVVKISFDPETISLDKLLSFFWEAYS